MNAEQAAKMREWQEAKRLLDINKAVEIKLRKELFGEFFPIPEEGTNTFELPEGWKIKGGYKLERKVDEAALPAVNAQLDDLGVAFDKLVAFKPSLVKKEWNKLSEEAKLVFDEALITKPGTPTLEVVPPKES